MDKGERLYRHALDCYRKVYLIDLCHHFLIIVIIYSFGFSQLVIVDSQSSFSSFCFWLVQVVQKEGIRALYRGQLATMIRTIPNASLQFTLYAAAKDFLLTIDSN